MTKELAKQIYDIYIEFTKKYENVVYYDEENKISNLIQNIKKSSSSFILYLTIYWYTEKYSEFNIEKFKNGNASFIVILNILSNIANIKNTFAQLPLNIIIHFGADKSVFEYFVNNKCLFITDNYKIKGYIFMINEIVSEKYKKYNKLENLKIPIVEFLDDENRPKIIYEFTEYLISLKQAEITGFILLNYINTINARNINARNIMWNKREIFEILKLICDISPHLANIYLYKNDSCHGTFLSLCSSVNKEYIDELKQMGFMKTVNLINTLALDTSKQKMMKHMCFACNVNPYKIVFPERYSHMMLEYNLEKRKIITERKKEYINVKRNFWNEYFSSKKMQKQREYNDKNIAFFNKYNVIYEEWKSETENSMIQLIEVNNSTKKNIFETSIIAIDEQMKRQEIFDKETIKRMCIDTFIVQLREKQNDEIVFQLISLIKQNPNIIETFAKFQIENENNNYDKYASMCA
jgi:hypothetical protein